MGCFSYTCSVSNLPIHHGDSVRFFALAAGERYRSRCDISGSWQPLLLPIEGKYDDYGSVEDIAPGPVTDAFFADLDRRSIERGVGDNRIHDVAIVKGMSREQWLVALWEDRVLIEGPDGASVEVAQAMVREDVWQFLASARAQVIAKLEIDRIIHGLAMTTLVESRVVLEAVLRNDGMWAACRDLFAVMNSLQRLGKPWARGSMCGPQFGDWDFQFSFARRLCEIAHAKLEADREAFGEDDEGDAEVIDDRPEAP